MTDEKPWDREAQAKKQTCSQCKGSGSEFPGNPMTEKCEECDGKGQVKAIKIVVSETVKPPAHPFYGDSYDRGLDPWHIDAFKGLPNGIANDPAWNRGKRIGGWFLLDAYGQEIGFIPDGTEY